MSSMPRTVGELRKQLAERGASWRPDPKLPDDAPAPMRRTGGKPITVPIASVPPVDFERILATRPARSLASRQSALNMGPHITRGPSVLPPRIPMAPDPTPAPAPAGHPKAAVPPYSTIYSAVDWRDRWGFNWITQPRDQGGCDNCWVFAATGLVEAMTRIQHCVWAPRSEGDLLWAADVNCHTSGSITGALDTIIADGQADRDCVQWVGASTVYHPTSDRDARIVRIPNYTYVGSMDDQKRWLLEVGPLGTQFYVWRDFLSYGHGEAVYHVDTTQIGYVDAQHRGDEEGWHALLVVGFNDALRAWIVKNSWGTGWGYGGFAYIGYGETEIDSAPKIGIHLTNPDTWTKRRLHSGALLEGNLGPSYDELEIIVGAGANLTHLRRDTATSKWVQFNTIATDVGSFPPAILQSTLERDFDVVYVATPSNMLHGWKRYAATGQWVDGGLFGPADVAGAPALIQSNYDSPGPLELVVRSTAGELIHLRHSAGVWKEVTRFAANVAQSGATLLQSSFGKQGDFDFVCVLNDGTMQHWRRSNDAGEVWASVSTFGTNVHSAPCMVESQFWTETENQPGNFELCVAVNGKVEHWWRDNRFAGTPWQFGVAFGHDVASVAGLVQSSAGFDLELAVITTQGEVHHYWRNGSTWHEGPKIV